MRCRSVELSQKGGADHSAKFLVRRANPSGCSEARKLLVGAPRTSAGMPADSRIAAGLVSWTLPRRSTTMAWKASVRVEQGLQ
jgi:hypothetical protein